MTLKHDNLQDEIKNLRESLNKLLEEPNFDLSEALKISSKLDVLIVEYYRMDCKNTA